MSDNLILYYSHAPITSCDTERSFSRYKNILSDTRRKFKFSNLKMHIIIHCNAHEENEDHG